MKKLTPKDELYNLPFDQFSRQFHVFSIVEGTKTSLSESYNILDVGGYKGETASFHINDSVTIADIQNVKDKENYVKVEGVNLPFKDNSYDFVVSFDTFEHIPRTQRNKFVKELIRVSKHGVLLAAPFDDDNRNVSQAEVKLNEYHQSLYGKPHRWLKEHIEYKIPAIESFEKMLKKDKIKFNSLKTNELKAWIQLQTLHFSIGLDDEFRGRIDDINRFYNRNIENIDIQAQENVSYRRIYILFKGNLLLKSTDNYIKKLSQTKLSIANEIELFSRITETIGIKYRDVVGHRNYLEKELIDRNNTVKSLREILGKRWHRSLLHEVKKITLPKNGKEK